jgi:hypothetical protein
VYLLLVGGEDPGAVYWMGEELPGGNKSLNTLISVLGDHLTSVENCDHTSPLVCDAVVAVCVTDTNGCMGGII